MRVRCYIPPEAWDSFQVEVTGSQAHHLVDLFRLSPGDRLTCFNGQGQEADAQVTQIRRRAVTLMLGDRRVVPPPPWRLSLGCAVPKKGLDQVVSEATQLGVSQIIPVTTARSVVRWSPKDWPKKQARLTQIITEAGKQSWVSHLPLLLPVTPWKNLLASFSRYDLVLMATVAGPHELLRDLIGRAAAGKILLLIGPEGDFAAEEIEQAASAGAHRIQLASTVLRVETACVAAVALLTFLLRERAG